MTLKKVSLVLLLILIAWASFALRTHATSVLSADFHPLHLGTQCLIDRCDPYASDALNREAALRHETTRQISPEAPVYPPSALIVLSALAPVSEPLAGSLFTLLSAIVAAFTMTLLVFKFPLERSLPAVLVLIAFALAMPLTDALQFGNPALLAVALAVLSLVVPAAWVPLGLALALKPQLAAPVLLYALARRESRTNAFKALALFLGLLIVGVAATAHATGSTHFLAEIPANLRLAAMPGHSTDPSPANDEAYSFLNLQPLFARLISIRAASLCAWSLALGLTIFLRRRSPGILLALFTLLLLMPVYHREYDRVIAMLLLPAVLELRGRTRWLFAATVILWLTSDLVLHHVLRRAEFLPWTPALTLALALILILPSGNNRLSASPRR